MTPPARIDITVLLCTYNRAADLEKALGCALAQETAGEFGYEIVVVDNNSSDRTREVVERLAGTAPIPVRYLFEKRQGRGYALNTGLAAVRGEFYAILDDDIILPGTYLLNVVRAFRRAPEISFVGGKVLPCYESERPAWLDEKHWPPLALNDRGDQPILFERGNAVCLLLGSFRTAEVREAGGYGDRLGVAGRSPGGVEDDDLYGRLYAAGKKGLYDPALYSHHKVESYRMTKNYHRRWHTGRGRTYAIRRSADFERSKFHVLGVPSHVWHSLASGFVRWLRSVAAGRWHDAFYWETHIRFGWGYCRERVASWLQNGKS